MAYVYEPPFKKYKFNHNPVVEKVSYLWNNSLYEGKTLQFNYLDKDKNIISGNIVTKRPLNPFLYELYNEEGYDNYRNTKYCGIAHHFVNAIEPK